MKITEIENPAFLKTLKINELKVLAEDIRTFLLENISKTGGHLSSNLGVVELTIALHQNFDFSHDKIFFDIGHQSYTHKILTGRAGQFNTLRKLGGISGFQKTKESPYDHWEAGHAGTSLSAALADQIAVGLNREKHYSVVVIGDAAIANGESFEALDHIGSLHKKVIIVLNDNQMSISALNNAFSRTLSRMRSSGTYSSLKGDVRKILGEGKVGRTTAKRLQKFKESVKTVMLNQNYFDDLGINYYGPVDGHNFKELQTAFKYAKNHNGPLLIHVKTTKGKGYAPSEHDHCGTWHGVPAFQIDNGEFDHNLPENYLSWSEAASEILLNMAEEKENIVALTPAMVIGSKLEKFFAKYPKRSFDCGIAEDHAATLAAGLALAGKKPFLAIYSTFLQRAYDQINHDICRMDLPVILGIDRVGLVGEDGDTHHGVFDIGILRPLPNIIIAQAKDYQELKSLFDCAYQSTHPFAIRYPRGNIERLADPTGEIIEVGKWKSFNIGEKPQAIIITYGPSVDKVVEKLTNNDYSAMVVNARFFKPLDEVMLKELASKQLPIVVYESDMLKGGLSTAIIEFYNDEKINVKVLRLGISDHYVTHGSITELRKLEKIDINSFYDYLVKSCG